MTVAKLKKRFSGPSKNVFSVQRTNFVGPIWVNLEYQSGVWLSIKTIKKLGNGHGNVSKWKIFCTWNLRQRIGNLEFAVVGGGVSILFRPFNCCGS